jgi:hypothetical protein
MLSQLPGKNAAIPSHLKVQILREQASPPSAATAKWPLHIENPEMMQSGNTVLILQHDRPAQ